ncbi:40S ribosomal protein S17, partial [Gonapodya sp. JEL0774]
GRVRTKTVKKASRVLIEKYYPTLTTDFQTNKRRIGEVTIVASKRLRNKIAGFTTHLMKRIALGPVRGISFKLQEEEREKKDNYVPEVSALSAEGGVVVDRETQVGWVGGVRGSGAGAIGGTDREPHGGHHASFWEWRARSSKAITAGLQERSMPMITRRDGASRPGGQMNAEDPSDVSSLLKSLGFDDLPGVVVAEATVAAPVVPGASFGGGRGRGRRE